MPASADAYFTREMVLALPEDGKRYELAYGELLVSPSPSVRHQTIVIRLAHILVEYCRRERQGQAFTSPADLSWGRDDIVVQPDVFVVGPEHVAARTWEEMRNVRLAIEVLSPSTQHADRFDKRRVYQNERVELYWIVDPDARVAEVWTPEVQFPTVERECLIWHPAGASASLIVDLNSLFKE